MYNIVSNIKHQLDIGMSDYPLNIFEVCKNISNVDIKAVPFKTDDLRGIVSLARNESEIHAILVNSNKSFEEQNFHGFHELMHIPTVDQPGTILRCFDTIKPTQDSYLEWLANEGAAEFVAPYYALLPMVKDEIDVMSEYIGTWNFCDNHSVDFGVSPIVLQNRIESLKYEIFQYLNGVPLDKIEVLSLNKQKQRGISVKSLVELENERLRKMQHIAM